MGLHTELGSSTKNSSQFLKDVSAMPTIKTSRKLCSGLRLSIYSEDKMYIVDSGTSLPMWRISL